MSATSTQTIELIGDQELVLERTPVDNTLKIVASDGSIRLSIYITGAGPVLRLEGATLMIQATGALAIDARSLILQGREGLALISGADAAIKAAGDLDVEARVQNLTAVLGDVNIKANDDVKLNGERVRLNC